VAQPDALYLEMHLMKDVMARVPGWVEINGWWCIVFVMGL